MIKLFDRLTGFTSLNAERILHERVVHERVVHERVVHERVVHCSNRDSQHFIFR